MSGRETPVSRSEPGGTQPAGGTAEPKSPGEAKSTPLDAQTARELIAQLRSDRELILSRYNGVAELLARNLAIQGGLPAVPPLDPSSVVPAPASDAQSYLKGSSLITGEVDSDEEDIGSLFASKPLEPEDYTIDGLLNHIRTFNWPAASKQVLEDLHENEDILRRTPLFPEELDTSDDRSHLTHYS